MQVEELLDKNDVDVLLNVAEQLEYEQVKEFREKLRALVINSLPRHF